MNLSANEYEEKIGLKGVLHFSDDVSVKHLKWEFMNLHTQCKTELSGTLNCFHDVLDLFAVLKKGSFNFKVSSPNVYKLLRLVMIHPATTATCERSFSLMRVIKSYLRSTMTDKRFNHLSVLKHYTDELMEIDLEDVMAEFVAANDARLNTFGYVKRT